MRKLFFMAALASVAFASCTKDENFYENEKQAIDFNPVAHISQSRADYTGSAFGAFAWVGTTSNDPNTDVFMNGVEVTKNEVAGTGSKWQPTTVHYWPDIADTDVDFCCFSPYTLKSSVSIPDANSFKIATQTIVPGKSNDDIMYTSKAIKQTKATNATSGVAVVFNHALAQLKFTVSGENLTYGGVTYTINVTKITVTGIQHKGSLTMALNSDNINWDKPLNEIWAVEKGTTDNFVINGSQTVTGSSVQIGTNVYVLPQQVKTESITATIDYTIKTAVGNTESTDVVKQATFNISGVTPEYWQMNKVITYNIKFNPTNNLTPIYFVPTVNDWGQVAGAEDVINPNA